VSNDVRKCYLCDCVFDHELLGRYGCPNCFGEGWGYLIAGEAKPPPPEDEKSFAPNDSDA